MKECIMDIKIACQTITWGDGQAERLDSILAAAKAAGFEGVEFGFRHIKDVPPAVLSARLTEHGLVLAATHVGGNLEDMDQAGGERGVLDQIMDYLDAVGARLLMYSGLNGESADAVAADIAMLGRAAERAARRGIRLLHHNHHWEFLRPGIMDALLADSPPSLGLCPDVGWLYRAGVDALPFLKAHASRIGPVHFKDFATPGDGTVSFRLDTAPLGRGLAPLQAVADWLRCSHLSVDHLWVIAEQDRHDGPVAEAVGLNGRFMIQTLKKERM
jgi:sugar phosphate isomerase/epimerase